MPIVSDTVSHMIEHINAEAAHLNNPNQDDKTQDRADYALDAIDIFIDDNRVIEANSFLKELALSGKPGLLRGAWGRMLLNAEDDPRPRLVISHWLEMGTEARIDPNG